MSTQVSANDPLHSEVTNNQLWSRQIVAEALPGVLTPLNWSIWGYSGERAMRAAYFDLGVLPESEVEPPASADELGMAIFYGRAAVNIDRLCTWADCTPGVSGAQFEAHYHGSDQVRKGAGLPLSRYPSVIARLPLHVAQLPWKMPRLRTQAHAMWESCTEGKHAPDEATTRARLRKARHWLHVVARPHAVNNVVVIPLFQQLTELAEAAGRAGDLGRLTSGYGALEETAMAVAMWDVSQGHMELSEFLRRHGYHSPDEGEIMSRSWREDPEPVRALLRGYAGGEISSNPRETERRVVREREQLQAEILAALSPTRRARARLVFRLARTYLPLRQVGHNTSVQMLDAVRASVREFAPILVARGCFEDPEDIFFLTIDELLTGPPPDAKERIAFRRDRWLAYRELDLPPAWRGQPEPKQLESVRPAHQNKLVGRGVSPGLVDGPARVVAQASDADALERGDILVCHTTDPSFTPYFAIASAVVIEIGGPLSHGAIVARELGIPCVIAEDATREIRDGQHIRVDGNSGEIEIVAGRLTQDAVLDRPTTPSVSSPARSVTQDEVLGARDDAEDRPVGPIAARSVTQDEVLGARDDAEDRPVGPIAARSVTQDTRGRP